MSKKFIDLTERNAEILQLLSEQLTGKLGEYTDRINISLDLSGQIAEETKDLIPPSIYITDSAWVKMQQLIQRQSGEVAWHGTVEAHPDSRFIISDILVFPQHVTGGTVSGVDGDYEMWVASQPDEVFDFMRFHGHSHVNMGVTPSLTDETYYKNLMLHVTDYYITLVINKKNETTLRFYDKTHNILYENLTLQICKENGELYDDWYTQAIENIKEPVRPVTAYSSYGVPRPITLPTKHTKKSKKSGRVGIISPITNKLVVFNSYQTASEFIRNYYYKQHGLTAMISEIKMWLEQEGYVAIDETGEIVDSTYTLLQDSTALDTVDIWEVANESK